MQIELPTSDHEKLAHQAAANGFASVEDYASDLLACYAQLAVDPADEAALRQSLDGLAESSADMAAGRTHDLRDALREIAERHGLKINP